MPLRAFFAGRELLAPLMSDEEWLNLKAQRPKVRLCCCDSTGYLRTSKLGTKHFVHGKDRIFDTPRPKGARILGSISRTYLYFAAIKE